MKQTSSPPPCSRASRHRLRLVALLVLFSGWLSTGELLAQSPVTPLAPGKLLHVRLTNYGLSTIKSDVDQLRNVQVQTGLELVYEKVGDAGRGTRYLLGWAASVNNSSTSTGPNASSYYNTNRQTFRIGVGKSQAAQYKRLVLRGGVDTYLGFSPGLRANAYDQDSAGIQDDAIKGAPSFRLAARPFIGLGFQISERTAIGLEYGTDLGIEATVGGTRYTYSGAFNSDNKIRQTRFGLFVNNPTLPFIHFSFRF